MTTDRKLIIAVIRRLHDVLGTSFSRRDYQRTVKPILVAIGRQDLNTGGWVGRKFDRPFHMEPSPDNRAADQLSISTRWLAEAGLGDDVLDEQVRELDEWSMHESGEPWSDWVARRLAADRD